MVQLFKFRLAISLALLLLLSAAKASYAYSKEKGEHNTSRLSQYGTDAHLQDENHGPIALFIQAITDATKRVCHTATSGGGASCRFTEDGTISFYKKSDIKFNFIRWHVLHRLIHLSQLRGRYPQHGFW